MKLTTEFAKFLFLRMVFCINPEYFASTSCLGNAVFWSMWTIAIKSITTK
jgi:hypothetical protein